MSIARLGTVLLAGCLLVLLAGACQTVENVRIIQQTLPYVDGDLTISATFLEARQLIGRYGHANPFLPPSRLLTPIEFIVIELSVDAPAEFGTFRSQDIKFQFNEVNARPVSTTRLLSIWESEIDVHGTDVVHSDYRRLIRAFLAPRDISGGTTRLLLFQGNFPLEGTMLLSVPHLDPANSQNSDIKTIAEARATPIDPVFDGKRVYFNFMIKNEERAKESFWSSF